jgi:hypothetical protein
MTDKKLATLVLESPYALPLWVARELMTKGAEPVHTYEEALEKFKDDIKNYGLKTCISCFYKFREAAKDLPELQPAVEELAKNGGDFLNNKKVIDGVNKIYDCVNDFKRPPVVESSFLDLMDLYSDTAFQVGDWWDNPTRKKISFINN